MYIYSTHMCTCYVYFVPGSTMVLTVVVIAVILTLQMKDLGHREVSFLEVTQPVIKLSRC